MTLWCEQPPRPYVRLRLISAKSPMAFHPILTIFFRLIEFVPPWRGLNEIGTNAIFS